MHLLVGDIETTGLDPLQDQILEFGVIAVDMGSFEREQFTFQRLVKHERYTGNAFALALNAEILKEIDAAEKERDEAEQFNIKLKADWDAGNRRMEGYKSLTDKVVTLEELPEVFVGWLKMLPFYGSVKKFTWAGKNFGSFDSAFLRMVPGWSERYREMKLAHRIEDPGPIYGSMVFDDQPPDLKEVLKRAAIVSDTINHRVLADAQDVLNALKRRSHTIRHIKTGNLYEIVLPETINATNANDGQKMVVYRNAKGEFFVREIHEFKEKFDY